MGIARNPIGLLFLSGLLLPGSAMCTQVPSNHTGKRLVSDAARKDEPKSQRKSSLEEPSGWEEIQSPERFKPLKRRTSDPVKDDWYKFCTISLEWLNPYNYNAQELKLYVDQLLDTAQSININTMAYTVDSGGYALWNSNMVDKSPHIGNADLFELLDRETHKRGMKFVAGWLGAPRHYPAVTYETWRRRDAKGESTDQGWLKTVCFNSPFGTFTAREFREVLSQYRIDAIYLEGLGYSPDICFCSYCQEKFRRTYGYAMPTDPAEVKKSADLRRFSFDTVTNFVRRLRNVIDEVSPNTVFMVCVSPGDDYEDIAKYADVTEMELAEGIRADMTQAMTRRFSFMTIWPSYHVDSNYMQRPSAPFRSEFIEKLAHDTNPQVHIQNALEVDRTLVPTLRELYGVMEKVRPTMKEARRIAEVGLYMPWQKDESIPYDELFGSTSYEDFKAFRGYYKVLSQSHIPFRLLSRLGLTDENFSDLKAIVLPNAVKMSDAEITNIRRFVEGGGGLVMTYRTSMADESGKLRKSMALADVAGIRGPFGLLTNPSHVRYPNMYEILPHQYYRLFADHPVVGDLRGRLLSYAGGALEFELEPGTREIGAILDYDYGRMHWQNTVLGWYPWERITPLVTANERKGRVVYIGGELAKEFQTNDDYAAFHILDNAVQWASKGSWAIQTDAPPTVEITAYRSESPAAITVFLRNLNITRDYVQALHEVNVKIANLSLQLGDVSTVTGASVNHRLEDRTLSLTLSKLNEYEIITVRGR